MLQKSLDYAIIKFGRFYRGPETSSFSRKLKITKFYGKSSGVPLNILSSVHVTDDISRPQLFIAIIGLNYILGDIEYTMDQDQTDPL